MFLVHSLVRNVIYHSVCVRLFVGNGTVRLGSHSAQRTTSAFPARRYNTRQDYGRQSVMGWRENCHYYLQVCHVGQASC